MKKYMTPEMDIHEFEVEDVIEDSPESSASQTDSTDSEEPELPRVPL